MQIVEITYIGDPPLKRRIAIAPIDVVISKRELAGKSYADGEYLAYYQSWLAEKRVGNITGVSFDLWLEGLAQLPNPIMNEDQIRAALATGSITEKQAEYWRSEMGERGEGLGESPPPPTP